MTTVRATEQRRLNSSRVSPAPTSTRGALLSIRMPTAMSSPFKNVGPDAETWAAIGLGVGWLTGCAARARQEMTKQVLSEIVLWCGFCTAAGAAFGILLGA
jgi:hypothetical protein